MSLALTDTNILLRMSQTSHPLHSVCSDALAELRHIGDKPCLVAQNLIEYRAVATRPVAVNGLGWSELDADAEIARLKSLFSVFPDDPRILAEWERLVVTYGASGKQNHDARIVAAMIVHGVEKILTLNASDFVRYSEIKVLTPQEVIANSNNSS